jgi:hypothetical protein
MNQSTAIRRTLYDLKKRYGVPIDMYTHVVTSQNVTTGEKVATNTKYHIRKAIVLPEGFDAKFLFTRAYLQNVGKAFAYGGVINQDTRHVLVDGSDLPKNLIPGPDAYWIYEGVRYETSRVDSMSKNLGHLVVLKRLTGVERVEINAPTVRQTIRFNQTAVGVLN